MDCSVHRIHGIIEKWAGRSPRPVPTAGQHQVVHVSSLSDISSTASQKSLFDQLSIVLEIFS